MNLTEKDKGLHVYFGDIHHGKDARSIYLYACLYECETGNLIISVGFKETQRVYGNGCHDSASSCAGSS